MRRTHSALTLALLACLAAGPADAATFTVTSGADGGPGSLQQAIASANANGEANVINVAPEVRTIRTSSEMPITSNLELNGQGVTIQGGSTRIFNVTRGTAAFNRITFTRGTASSLQSGGAVLVSGNANAHFTNCTFFGNTASVAGGAVCVDSVSLNNTTFQFCTIAGNSAASGGGVAVANGAASFLGVIAVGNRSTRSGAGDDLHAEGAGAISSVRYNVLGTSNAGVGPESLANQRAEDVFLAAPLKLESANGVEVLKLSGASPARDLIPSSAAGAVSIDECGTLRPQLVGYDAGAFEATPVALVSADLAGTPYVQLGQGASYDVKVFPADASLDGSVHPGGVEWIVGDATVLSVDRYGHATALRDGMTTLSAVVHGWTAAGGKASASTRSLTVRVGRDAPIVLLSMDVIPDQTLALNQVRAITPTVRTTLNGETLDVPYTLQVTANSTAGVAEATVLNGRTIQLTGRAQGTTAVVVTASANLSGSGYSNSTTTSRSFVVTVREHKSGKGGGCNAASSGLAMALAAAFLLRRRA